jgi:Holliday junction resolvasome RuvABC endonuclease subunit
VILLGIDPGKKMGVARVRVERSVVVIDCHTIEDVTELGEHLVLVEHVALEWWEYQGPKKSRGVPHAAEVAGRVAGYLDAVGTPYTAIKRGQVLSGLNLRRSAGKDQVYQTIRALTSGACPRNDHESDAVAVAIVGAGAVPLAPKGAPCVQRSRRSPRPTTGTR